jgi:hypothetical protein
MNQMESCLNLLTKHTYRYQVFQQTLEIDNAPVHLPFLPTFDRAQNANLQCTNC